jgi:GTPase SAR1 family protein
LNIRNEHQAVPLLPVLQVRVNLWDLAGSPDYIDVRNEFYKDSQAAVLVRTCTDGSDTADVCQPISQLCSSCSAEPCSVIQLAAAYDTVSQRMVQLLHHGKPAGQLEIMPAGNHQHSI